MTKDTTLMSESESENFYFSCHYLGEDAGLMITILPMEFYLGVNDLVKLTECLERFQRNGARPSEIQTRNFSFDVRKDEEDSTKRDIYISIETYRIHMHPYFEPEDFTEFVLMCQEALKTLRKRGILKTESRESISFKGIVSK